MGDKHIEEVFFLNTQTMCLTAWSLMIQVHILYCFLNNFNLMYYF